MSISQRVAALLSESAPARPPTDDPSSVRYIDLYREQFDPVLRMTELMQHWSFDSNVQHSIRDLQQSDVVVIVHPVWWAGMPALLSGWIQRVWKHEIAFCYEGDEFTYKVARGLFSDKRFLIIYLSDESATDLSCRALEAQWQHILEFCAVKNMVFAPIHDARGMSTKQRNDAVMRVCTCATELTSR